MNYSDLMMVSVGFRESSPNGLFFQLFADEGMMFQNRTRWSTASIAYPLVMSK